MLELPAAELAAATDEHTPRRMRGLLENFFVQCPRRLGRARAAGRRDSRGWTLAAE